MAEIGKRGLLGIVLTLLLLAGCAVPGFDGVTGGGGRPPTDTTGSDLQGTIQQINLQDQSLLLRQTNRSSSNLVNRDDSARIYFDDRTNVTYNGRAYQPEDLEIGDEVAVQLSRSGGRLFATSMTVISDVSSGTGTQNGSRTTQLQGTVQDVDPRQRMIDVDLGYSRKRVRVLYDANTYVDQNGRRYRPEELRRGDEVRIDARETGRGQFMADNISVMQGRTGDRGDRGDRYGRAATVRGMVRDIDPNRQTIAIDQTQMGSSFNPSRGNLLTLQYDANTIVEYRGDRYDPSNLERGDIVDVEVQDMGRNQVAQRIVVVRDARSSSR